MTFYILYVLAGGGFSTSSWGGPSVTRFDTHEECRAAADVLNKLPRTETYIIAAQCHEVKLRGILR